jgi:hypothetical protein
VAGRITYHDRVLAMAERLVREHPKGQEVLALILAGRSGASDTSDRAETIEVVFSRGTTPSGRSLLASPAVVVDQGADDPQP